MESIEDNSDSTIVKNGPKSLIDDVEKDAGKEKVKLEERYLADVSIQN